VGGLTPELKRGDIEIVEKGKKGRKGKQGKESDRGCHVKGEQGKQAKGKLIKKIQQPLA
jgi:hypothetical protein